MGISVVSRPQTNTHPEAVRERTVNPKNYVFLIPTITVIALGAIFVPYFALGLGFGALSYFGSIALSNALSAHSEPEEKNSDYDKYLRQSLLYASVFGPIAEESLYRGGMQPILTKVIQVLFPAATATLFGPFSIATAVSVTATAVIFGGLHYFNSHKNSHIQAINCTVFGFMDGVLCAQFGLAASIASHIANNTICAFSVAGSPSDADANIHVEPRQRFTFSALPA